MSATRIISRLPVGFGFLAISGALFYRATQFYSASWALLAPLSGIFLALAIPWIVSALRAWNVWSLHLLAYLLTITALPWGMMVVGAMAASAHHAGDFTAHAVAVTGGVTSVQDKTDTDSAHNTVVWQSEVTIALGWPVGGQTTIVLRLPHESDYAVGDQARVLVDPRHPGDVELPGHQDWTTKGRVLGWIGAAGLLGFALAMIIISVAEGPDSDERKPDFLDATRESWARWRAEPQDFTPWTGAVRAVAWLPFLAVGTLSGYAVLYWSQWWLFLLPGVLLSIGSAAAATSRSFPRLRNAALPLATLSAAAAVPVLLITGVLPPAAGLLLMAAAWLTGVIAASSTDQPAPACAPA